MAVKTSCESTKTVSLADLHIFNLGAIEPVASSETAGRAVCGRTMPSNCKRNLLVLVATNTIAGKKAERKKAMRSLLAVALLGVGAVLFSANAPAQAMTAGSAGIAKSAGAGVESNVHDVRKRWRGHRGWHRHHRFHRHRSHRHRHYSPYYYGGYYPYYYRPYRYYRRPGVRLYFGF